MSEEQSNRYVVYRTYLGDFDFLRERLWDRWVEGHRDNPAPKPEEVSRGHTLVEALNLTAFANKLENDK